MLISEKFVEDLKAKKQKTIIPIIKRPSGEAIAFRIHIISLIISPPLTAQKLFGRCSIYSFATSIKCNFNALKSIVPSARSNLSGNASSTESSSRP